MATEDSPRTESKRAATAKSQIVEPATPGNLISLPVVVGLSIMACLAVGSVIWFIATEPPSRAPENDSVGSLGNTRSPSQIIRAARRAQERSQAEGSGQ
jgi:hypothetical protein